MPFDGFTFNNHREFRLTPSLQNLSYILKHKEIWPSDFKWYYGSTFTCALALIDQYWPEYEELSTKQKYAKFGLNSDVGHYIFFELGFLRKFKFFGFTFKYPVPFHVVTPVDVAEEIDKVA